MNDDGDLFRLPGEQDVLFDGVGWVLWKPPDETTKRRYTTLADALRAAGRGDLALLIEDDQAGRRR